MKVTRRFTRAEHDPYESIEFIERSSEIRNPDGGVVFAMDGVKAPKTWSQVAVDVLVQKYFRKAGVPQLDDDGSPEMSESGEPLTGPERDARQVFDRLAGCWTHWGKEHGYFDTDGDAEAFHDELRYMLAAQFAAPNSPQWFNTGLHWAYGITGPAQGHWFADPESGKLKTSSNAYEHPQPHACFIQSVADDLVNEGGIMNLWVREARLFKYGSGTGTNFSQLRGHGEPLSGGGRSSGLMSFLKIGDRAAGAIKSGGTTRRAAKMVCLDLDHPDIEEFISWKAVEERKVAALVTGSRLLRRQLQEILDACFPNRVGRTGHGPGEELRPQDGDPNRAPAGRAGRFCPARVAARCTGRADLPGRGVRYGLGFGRLLHGVGPERQQQRSGAQRVFRRARGQPRLEASQQNRQCSGEKGPRGQAVERHHPRGLGVRRPRAPVRRHHQRVAHVPSERAHQRLEPVLRVHVPR